MAKKPELTLDVLFEATRERFRKQLDLGETRTIANPYRSAAQDSLAGVWVGAMDSESWFGHRSIHLEFQDEAVLVESGRGTELASVNLQGRSVEVLCRNTSPSRSFRGIRRGDEIAGYWGRPDDANKSVGEFYLIRRESVPKEKADALAKQAAQSAVAQGVMAILLVVLLAGLDGFAESHWGIPSAGLFPGLLLGIAIALRLVAFGRRSRAWAKTLEVSAPRLTRVENVRVEAESTLDDETTLEAASEEDILDGSTPTLHEDR